MQRLKRVLVPHTYNVIRKTLCHVQQLDRTCATYVQCNAIRNDGYRKEAMRNATAFKRTMTAETVQGAAGEST